MRRSVTRERGDKRLGMPRLTAPGAGSAHGPSTASHALPLLAADTHRGDVAVSGPPVDARSLSSTEGFARSRCAGAALILVLLARHSLRDRRQGVTRYTRIRARLHHFEHVGREGGAFRHPARDLGHALQLVARAHHRRRIRRRDGDLSHAGFSAAAARAGIPHDRRAARGDTERRLRVVGHFRRRSGGASRWPTGCTRRSAAIPFFGTS